MAMDVIPDSTKSQEEMYKQLLIRLTGVFAANVHLSSNGAISEIHILGSSSRNPKQIMRDVQSALVSTYGVTVDHRVISIAQLREDPIQSSDESVSVVNSMRLRSHELTQNVLGDQYSVKITLKRDNVEYIGQAFCKNTSIQRPRAVANAVLQAVHKFLGVDQIFLLLSVQFTQLSSVKAAVIAIECDEGEDSPVLIGAAECADDEAQAIVRATLDALNRKLSRIVATPC